MPDQPAPVRAPELDGAIEWLNVPVPLSLKALRGKVVLLDFWTYGCINCMHVLTDLKRLEQKYAEELVVIGVHSAKFANERVSDNLRRIIVRYEIDHPVANDAAFRIWRAYGVHAWPTQVLIDPAGYVVGAVSGEGNANAFDQAIAAVIQVFDERGHLDRQPLPLAPEHERLARRPLAFPGKVLAQPDRDRLFIADSNHHRILVATLDGRVTTVIGSGTPGRANGAPEHAEFYRPQGLAVDGDALYVADTENHLIRVVDLAAGSVLTLAGTGRQAAWADGGAALETALNSPWDLALAGRLLLVAMAGPHQIWMVDLDRRLALRYAGTGREARLDGSADEAAFAQPSGLTIGGDTLFVADSESNIVRAVTLPPRNEVQTLAGGDLFDFGDVDGCGDLVRLQHPLGVAFHEGRVYIADTYNHKIKVLDPAARSVTTFAGSGASGHDDGPAPRARFYEPGGLSVGDGRLYIADTNNHTIRTVDLRSGDVRTLTINGL